MTLPIGSGFYSGDIPGKFSRKQITTDKPQALSEQTAEQNKAAEYVKSSPQGLALAEQLQSAAQSAYQQTIYDKPNSPKISRAISTYTEFANLERRAEVQNLIGVDVFA
ncbi:hypothetical protein [Pseudoalteromonas mariniglutinosa]|uniref:hypothetical protein n=1 Tax=Pseudoalteromonas mariniglutinosa TaxID=206042 RepID=UPI00384BC225